MEIHKHLNHINTVVKAAHSHPVVAAAPSVHTPTVIGINSVLLT